MPEATIHQSPADYFVPGLRILTGEASAPWAMVIQAVARPEGWVLEPTRTEERIIFEQTATTILYRGNAFRILEEEKTEIGWTFRLMPCPDGESWLRPVELSRGNFESNAA